MKIPTRTLSLCPAALLISLLCTFVCVVLEAEGRAYTFGNGSNGQLGHGNTTLQADTPHEVQWQKNTKVKFASCGENHTAFVTGECFMQIGVNLRRLLLQAFHCPSVEFHFKLHTCFCRQLEKSHSVFHLFHLTSRQCIIHMYLQMFH